jgi:hypothetical protein
MALLAVMALVVLVVGLHQSGTRTTTAGPATSRVMPSTSDQWFAAVCKPGTFREGGGDGGWLTNAVGRASCFPANGEDSFIFIGQYSSEYLARNDAELYTTHATGSAATMADTEGYMLFVNMVDPSGASLQPLAHFGFAITPSHRGG